MRHGLCNSKWECQKVGSNPGPIALGSVWFVHTILPAMLVLSTLACGLQTERRGIPAEVESAISAVSEDIANDRYEKIYNEASELWRQDASLEQSISAFKTLTTKLGKVDDRTVLSATEQQNSGGPLKGDVFIITYQTKFEKGPGMETFTLVKRDNRWLLARYFVNSTLLK